MRGVLTAILILMALPAAALAQETRSVIPGRAPPAARVEDLAWLAGEWRGGGLGGPATETYSAVTGGQIVGHFVQVCGGRQDGGGAIMFMELVTIAPVGGSIEYRLLHFDAALRGWEERGRALRFPLVAVGPDAWYFDGLTIRRDGPDAMIGAVRIGNRDGTSREAVFRYRRVR